MYVNLWNTQRKLTVNKVSIMYSAVVVTIQCIWHAADSQLRKYNNFSWALLLHTFAWKFHQSNLTGYQWIFLIYHWLSDILQNSIRKWFVRSLERSLKLSKDEVKFNLSGVTYLTGTFFVRRADVGKPGKSTSVPLPWLISSKLVINA